MTKRNPYFIEGPAIISFSGGRSSGYMLKHILDTHAGHLPDDVRVIFCNTGKEMPETLDFVQECGERWSIQITWLEYRFTSGIDGGKGTHSFEIVNHNSASRSGEPFDMVIAARKMLPNPVTRFCTQDMKIRTQQRFARTLGFREYTSVIGLRADEPRRVAALRARSQSTKDTFDTACPMADAGATKNGHIIPWWNAQPFDLRLSNVNGSTPLGNCDLCFLKGAATVAGIIRQQPALADWWAEHERKEVERRSVDRRDPRALVNLDVARFRMDRPSYAEMQRLSRDQGDLLDNASLPCHCHD